MTKEERQTLVEVRREKRQKLFRVATIAFLDVVTLCSSYMVALWVRFDMQFGTIPPKQLQVLWQFMPILVLTTLIVYYGLRLYHSIWRYAGVHDVARAVAAYILLLPILAIEIYALGVSLPRSVVFIGYVLSFGCCVGIRLSYRFLRMLSRRIDQERHRDEADHVMIIGAGAAGRQLLREMATSAHVHGRVCCFIDDNSQKWHRNMEGVPIVGGRDTIRYAVDKYGIRRIIFAIPSMDPKNKQEILNICKETGCQVRIVPGIYQILNGEVKLSQLRDVDVLDLLGRDEIRVNNEEIMETLAGKVIMVTGGGGSIGSELCRQIAAAGPKQLIIFDIYENNAYEIQQELIRKYPDLNLEVLIGSVRNTNRVNWVLRTYRPDAIFHAAAHKHVPLMEDSPNEAVKNNVLGTYKLAMAAADAGVKRFLLISTDKAVNPTNVMGATKRICEMIVQMMNRKCPRTEFVAVRFGNVLGSNGSVIPLFKKQIAEGGPVTVTDKNIIRYFMTIQEAVSLVLQAGVYARGGEIFVLDMGQPVRIDDMARNLIKLSGYVPDQDIKIVYTGLRPGEKLYEELLMDEEGMEETANRQIFIGKPIEMDDERFMEQLSELERWSVTERDDIRALISQVVETYHAPATEKEMARIEAAEAARVAAAESADRIAEEAEVPAHSRHKTAAKERKRDLQSA
jgi:FlaA1/EpsC-like NDP-sugar epimerase